MKHPPYHLRPNKAVDRLLLVDVLTRIVNAGLYRITDYHYYGFGGPFLDDFRVLHQHFPELKLTSIERDESTFARQEFHRFARGINLHHSEVERFISSQYSPGKRDVFWLDYTDLKYPNFEVLEQLLPKLGEGSLVKVTFPAQVVVNISASQGILEADEFAARKAKLIDRFESRFSKVLPPGFASLVEKPATMAKLISQMVRLCVERVRLADGAEVIPLCSVRYADVMPMVSVALFVAKAGVRSGVKQALQGWPFAQLDWMDPVLVDLPILSAQERIKFQRLLPLKRRPAKRLSRALGYLIDSDQEQHQASLDQYASFHRYYPLFARVDF